MLLTVGAIAFILTILTVVSGFFKTRTARKLHEYFALLTVCSLALHLMEKFVFSFDCFLLIFFLSMTVVTAIKRVKIKNRIRQHTIFGVLTFLIVLWHIYPVFYSTILSAKLLPESVGIINETEIKLPEPSLEGEMSLEEALLERKSIRDYLDKDVPLEHLSQLLWAAQGITREWGGRTAPSAGATYPLELYVAVRRVERLNPGIYRYAPRKHSLSLIKSGDFSDDLMQASLNQQWVKDASLNIVVTAEFSRTTSRYGTRGRQYVYLEAGHAAQNVYLQVAALELGGVVIGAFNDEAVQNVIGAPERHEPIYVIPVGFPLSS